MFYIAAVPLPPAKRLTVADVYDAKGKPRPDILKQHFVLEGRLSDECALRIINDGSALLRAEKTMIDIEAPVTGRYGLCSESCHNWFKFDQILVKT